LLEEKRHTRLNALVANIKRPFGIHWPSAPTAFSADDNPIDAVKNKLANGRDKRLD